MKIREVLMSGVGYDHVPFSQTDAGRSNSRRTKQKNDCTVRVLALVQSMDYDFAYDLLAEAGRQCSRCFVNSRLYSRR